MRVWYKNYTLVLDFSKVGMYVPTFVEELRKSFDDVSQAKTWVDNNPKEEGDDKNER